MKHPHLPGPRPVAARNAPPDNPSAKAGLRSRLQMSEHLATSTRASTDELNHLSDLTPQLFCVPLTRRRRKLAIDACRRVMTS
jgi:hypothetical protein